MDAAQLGAVRVSGAVMTHPRRAELARELIERCRPEELDLVLDPEPDGPPTGLRTAVRAWSSVPAGATHRLVLQDDAVLTPGFFDHVRAAARAVPDAALAFYTHWQSRNAAAVRLAVLSGHRWAPATAEYTPTVVLLLPAPVAAGFARYAREHGATWADDVVMSRYLRAAGVPTYLAAPNLADHADVPSMHANGGHGPRRSACFASLPAGTGWELDGGLAELDAIPFLKYGRAQVATRLADGRWASIEAHRYLRRIGLDPEESRKRLGESIAGPTPRTAGLLAELDRPTVEAHWQTALLMGVVTATRRRAAEPDGVLADLALGTVGAGGLCTRFGDDGLARLRPGLLELARSAYAEGLAVGARCTPAAGGGGPVRPARDRRVVVTGQGGPDGTELAGALARILADGDWDVTLWGADGPDYPGVTAAEPGTGLAGAAALLQVAGGGSDAGPDVGPDAGPGEDAAALAAGVRATATATVAATASAAAAAGVAGSVLVGPAEVAGTTVLRPGLVYGPGIQDGSVLEQAVRRSLLARPIRPEARAGRRWQPVFVDDLAEAVDRALLLPAVPAVPGPPDTGQGLPDVVPGLLDVCGTRALNAVELAEAASAAVRPVPVEAARPGDRDAAGDPVEEDPVRSTEAAAAALGWQPRTPLADGLRAWSQWLAYEAEPRPTGGAE
ncbi:NAD-dependent epimerase/dehydratase family protein [Kitasatospora sp. NPDC058170]|uniref:NAD-dependent epimerase/dehydratase family protein n=1 Tax=Kitasatospora sp. NPDC058170 TaxID=3346364 RepID=UPI0036D98955